MIEFEMRGNVVKTLPYNLAQAAMRVLKKDGHKFSRNGNVVNLKTKAAMYIVLAF